MPVPTDKPVSSTEDEIDLGVDVGAAVTDDKPVDSSPAKDDAQPAKTGIDIVREALKVTEGDPGTSSEPEKKSDDTKVSDATDAKKTDDKAQDPEAEKAADDAYVSKMPLHLQPRFKERTKQLHEARAALTKKDGDIATLKADLDKAKPIIENAKGLNDFMSKTGLSGENVSELLTLGAMIRNPSTMRQARERITGILGKLDEALGEKLPTDLQKQVDDGDLTLEAARDLSRTKADKKLAEQTAANERTRADGIVKQQADRDAEQRQQQAAQAIETSVNKRVVLLSKSDPDFTLKQDTLLREVKLLIADRKGKPYANVEEALADVDKAYKSTNEIHSKFAPRRDQERRPVNSASAAKTVAELPQDAKGIDITRAALGYT